jgi:SAM-dependent methyltransferase
MPFSFRLETLMVDEWDRFHGQTDSLVPFVFSRVAQEKFFDLMDEFDDDSITYQEKNYPVKSYWPDREDLQESNYWENVYHEEKNPGWNLGGPAEALKDMLPRLKLPKSRILVLGCGEGHDAAHFAENGHVVTAVDFSKEAILRAQSLYGHMSNLKFEECDVFQLPQDWIGAFDIIFEHTCYCAINPSLRQNLVKVWERCLHDQGFLMGVFFTMEKHQGPPYGVTEWEIRQRLKSRFHFIFWGRWKKSLPKRQGRELFLYASKKNKK